MNVKKWMHKLVARNAFERSPKHEAKIFVESRDEIIPDVVVESLANRFKTNVNLNTENHLSPQCASKSTDLGLDEKLCADVRKNTWSGSDRQRRLVRSTSDQTDSSRKHHVESSRRRSSYGISQLEVSLKDVKTSTKLKWKGRSSDHVNVKLSTLPEDSSFAETHSILRSKTRSRFDSFQPKTNGASFETLAENPADLVAAHNFSRRFYMPEVTQFLYSVINYRRFCSSSLGTKELHQQYLELVSTFVMVGSKSEINISPKTREAILVYKDEEQFCNLLDIPRGFSQIFDLAYDELETTFLSLYCNTQICWFR